MTTPRQPKPRALRRPLPPEALTNARLLADLIGYHEADHIRVVRSEDPCEPGVTSCLAKGHDDRDVARWLETPRGQELARRLGAATRPVVHRNVRAGEPVPQVRTPRRPWWQTWLLPTAIAIVVILAIWAVAHLPEQPSSITPSPVASQCVTSTTTPEGFKVYEAWCEGWAIVEDEHGEPVVSMRP